MSHYFTKTVIKNKEEKRTTDFYYKCLFYAAFQEYVTLRESCYCCKFSGESRNSDITIGDFHEIDKYISGINRFEGVSTVIVNTEEGNAVFESLKNIKVIPVDIDKLKKDKTIFSGATKRPAYRDKFVECYNKYGLSGLEQKYFNSKRYLKQNVYYHLPRIVREKIKRIIS